jgi:hypothetical protein
MDLTLNLKVFLSENLNAELTSESNAILALVKYCDLKPNIDFECFCFYIENELNKVNKDIALVEHELNKSFPDFRFVTKNKTNSIQEKDKNGYIFIESLDKHSKDEYLHDTTLPSLKNCISKDSYMIITGLSSVYRFVVKRTNKYKPSLKLKNLLVNFYLVKKLVWSFGF